MSKFSEYDFKYYFAGEDFYGYDPEIKAFRKFMGYDDYRDYFNEVNQI